MEKIYKEMKELMSLKESNDEKIKKLDKNIKKITAQKEIIVKRMASLDKNSVDYTIDNREKEKLDNNITTLEDEKKQIKEQTEEKFVKLEAQMPETIDKKIDEAQKMLEDIEKIARKNILLRIKQSERDEVASRWDAFYGTEEFTGADELKQYLANTEEKSKELLETKRYLDEIKKAIAKREIPDIAKFKEMFNIQEIEEKDEEENEVESMWDAFYKNQKNQKSNPTKPNPTKPNPTKPVEPQEYQTTDDYLEWNLANPINGEEYKNDHGVQESKYKTDDDAILEYMSDDLEKGKNGENIVKNKDNTDYEEILRYKDETEEERKQRDKEAFEKEEARKKEIRDNSQKVRIAYSAKDNVFLIENRNGQYKPFRRTIEEINAISLEELAKKMGKEEKDFEDIGEGTILILKVLSCYDEKFYTNKAAECLEEQGGYKVKSSERNEKMDKKGIDIEINLKGLYGKKLYEKGADRYATEVENVNAEDRKVMKAVAKDMKKTGTGKVTEGIWTKLGITTGNIVDKITGKVKFPKLKLPKLLKAPKEKIENLVDKWATESKEDVMEEKVDTKTQEADIEEKVAKAATKMLDDEKKQKEESKDPGKKLGVKTKSNEEAAREEAAAKAAAKMLDDEKQQQEGQR